MDINLFEDLLNNLEIQIKQAESEIKIKSALALSEIEIIIESAVSVKEIIKFEKQYDEVEKKFEQEILKQKNKIIKAHLIAVEKLKKHLEKVYTKMTCS
jgi:L-fucose mutarotase/ribose pyranase (RbsD/FucU family)